MQVRKIIGIVFSAIALITLGIFITRTEFSFQLQAWLSFKYYMQFAPYFISIMLFYGGVYLIRENPKLNFALAVFGYTMLEITVLDWLGIVPNSLGTYPTLMFIGSGLAAFWISHANSFKSKKLSLKEILISVFAGALESLLLYYAQFN
ncbi:hypothetical protein [Reichenbachiella sp.]|uniref:hypothetical protein n=1 Tax=Reichenbachiella sp. TaxID=2184521 RepID=UPI003B5AA921